MPRIAPIDVTHATGDTAASLAAVKSKLGSVPNMFATLALAPAALGFYLQGAGALERGRFNAKQRELIALTVAETNACGYCLAAHTAIGGMVGLAPSDIEGAREGRAHSSRDRALLALARRIVETRGNLVASDFDAVRAGGLDDADVLETIAVVALNIFTNYVNHVAATVVDFPAVKVKQAA